MHIKTRLCMSLDGYITTAAGLPAQLADPDFSPQAYGFVDFQEELDAVLMGRETFEPSIGRGASPWSGLGVFVLGSHRPEGTPDDVVVESDPPRLLERLRQAHPDGLVHLVGGPSTVEAIRALGALDQLGLIVMPRLLGAGRALTPTVDPGTRLRLDHQHVLQNGAVELVYDVS